MANAQIHTRALCQLKTCNKLSSVWVAWPIIGVIPLCQDCWDMIHDSIANTDASPRSWAAIMRPLLRRTRK